ncbi:MAG TPA: SemiSWEET family transporter [Candidatus Dormibacteraeota bacterium]|nr:SemiSWEET family transporter [Candidatus Dormibacteraeota bacterium]
MLDGIHVVSIVGTLAAALTVFNMFPQYLKVMKTKHTKDLATATFISLTCSSFLWITYGALRHDHIILLANTPVFFFCSSILIMKVRHG